HAAVGVGKLAEIMMRAHLAAIDRVDLAHLLLDERMARLALHRLAARCLDDVERVPSEPRVVHDPIAGVLLQKTLREQPDDVVALDEVAACIKEEAAVVVAVPRETQIGALRAHALYRDG